MTSKTIVTVWVLGVWGALAAGCGGAQAPSIPPMPSMPPMAGANAGDMVFEAESVGPVELTSDEGMWLLNDFPSERLARRHGFGPDAKWLEHARLSSVRLAQGCSGSFVSPNGLVMTNHHCAVGCIQQLSSKRKDYVASGFMAKAESDEVRCPEMEINQLVAITDVTVRVQGAAKGATEAAANVARKAEMSKVEKECATSDDFRCDVVSLYEGGRYDLYKYRRYQDVRLVFAPEVAVAFFGGDPDNFNFPRYDLDVSFVRVYEGGKPAQTPNYFPWSEKGAAKGELTFVSGHPGSTSRMMAVSQLTYIRDVALPERLMQIAEERGMLAEFQKRGAEQKRISGTALFRAENGLKALRGRREALVDAPFFAKKVQAEQELRRLVSVDPKLQATYGDAWGKIAAVQDRKRQLRTSYLLLEYGDGFWSKVVSHARTLVRAAEELPKPNGERLREYTDSHLPALRQGLLSTAPIYEEFEIATLTLSLTQLREKLGPDHEVVKQVLGIKSPADVARDVVTRSRLKDVKVRKQLLDGGKAAVEASTDPAIVLARLISPYARAVRKQYEDEVEAVETRNEERIAKARFAIYGTSVYPDATFTLRLSFGVVKGWDEGGKPVEPFTTIGGAFTRHTGAPPFALPKSWLDAKSRLDLSTPMNLCTTNDIIGGNSGSPMINQKGEIVGLIFDGNIHSLGGDYAFDDRVNRAVAVHSAALIEALDKVYGATRVKQELMSTRTK